MMDAEMAFFEHKDNMIVQENLIYFIVKSVLGKCKNELKILERNISALEMISLPFERKTYTEIIKELKSL
jgi:asparaginyl-tRNA synthetase